MSSSPEYNRFVSTLPSMDRLSDRMQAMTNDDPAFEVRREVVGQQGEMTVFARAPQTLPEWFARADAFPSRSFLVLGNRVHT